MKRWLLGLAAVLFAGSAWVGVILAQSPDRIDLSLPMNVQANFAATVDKGSNQTISGVKDFTGIPKIKGEEFKMVLSSSIPSLGAQSTAWMVAPYNLDVVGVYTVLRAGITGVDTTLRLITQTGASVVTATSWTITQSGSATGDIDSPDFASGNPRAKFAVDAGGIIGVDIFDTTPTPSTVGLDVHVVVQPR